MSKANDVSCVSVERTCKSTADVNGCKALPENTVNAILLTGFNMTSCENAVCKTATLVNAVGCDPWGAANDT